MGKGPNGDEGSPVFWGRFAHLWTVLLQRFGLSFRQLSFEGTLVAKQAQGPGRALEGLRAPQFLVVEGSPSVMSVFCLLRLP